MQLCIRQSCKLSSEYSSSVPKPINRKDVEAPDVNKKAAPDVSRTLSALCCFSLITPSVLPEPGAVTGSAARARCAGARLHLVVPPR